MSVSRTLFQKIWDEHIVCEPSGGNPLIYVDLHLVHEVTSPQAFDGLRAQGRKVRQELAETRHGLYCIDGVTAVVLGARCPSA